MIVGALVYTVFVDFTGRLQLFIWPMMGCSFCLITMGCFFAAKILKLDLSSFYLVPVTLMTIYSALTAISLGSILLLRNEVFATDVRAVGVGATYAVLFTGAFAAC